MSEPLLEVQNLKVRFPIWGGVLRRKINEVVAVDDVSFTLHKGETLGLVGESGCGKTTIAKAICNLLKDISPGVVQEGQIWYHGKNLQAAKSDTSTNGPVDLLSLSRRQMRPYRSQIQMIFQDPFSSLNPRMTVGEMISRPLKIHTKMTKQQRKERVEWLLDRVGLQPDQALRYSHEFSGGQRQRIGIARALAVEPSLVIADEPVSALDVSIQSQIINLMQDLQEEFGLTYLFVAHDLSVVHHISDRIAVMYLGNMAEIGETDTVYHQAAHPYTQALLSAVPHPDPSHDSSGRIKLKGEIPSPLNKPTGCGFHPRCPLAKVDCAIVAPLLEEKEAGQRAACPLTK